MKVIYAIAIGLLFIAALLAIWRTVRGPSNADRILGADVLVVTLIGGLAVGIVATDTPAALPILMALSLVGFVGAVSVARMMVVRRDQRPR